MKHVVLVPFIIIIISCSNVPQSVTGKVPEKTIIKFDNRPLSECEIPVTVGDFELTMLTQDSDYPCSVSYDTIQGVTQLGLWPGKIRIAINSSRSISSIEVDYDDHCGAMSLISFDTNGGEIENFQFDQEKERKSKPVFSQGLDRIKSFTLEGGCEAGLTSITVNYGS